jgi:hypothetical protein
MTRAGETKGWNQYGTERREKCKWDFVQDEHGESCPFECKEFDGMLEARCLCYLRA